ncbi:sugar phosphate isomerase/epimerase family protein [Paenibacillus sp. MBLB4367]|uniref:sugar phosphate isomerase/epimerase family protein n=1 Tax=Paenibacillus sp. MBLB4367 TaxID=3384767 RepID=UPI0039082C66
MADRRLQIGMWGSFDASAWERFALGGINGLELCQMRDEAELRSAVRFCGDRGVAFGLHAPGIRRDAYVLPKLTSSDAEERGAAIGHAEEQVELAREQGADYVLLHFPFPAFCPEKRSEALSWIFPIPGIYDRSPFSERTFMEIGRRVFESLAELQLRYKQRIVLEYDFFGEYENKFIELFREFPSVEAVLDTQRLDLHARAFPGFDPYGLIDAMAPYTYLVHYSNIQYEEHGMKRHLPVLSEQEGDVRFGDAIAYLKRLHQGNRRFHLLFEHQASLVAAEELASCYGTAAQIIGL